MIPRALCLLSAVLSATGCPITAPYLCDDSLVLLTGEENPPVFSWGDEAVQSLWVHDGSGDSYWDLRCPDNTSGAWTADDACIASPVTYGLITPGTTEQQPATPLTPGTTARVEVYRIELGSSEGCWVGLDFTVPGVE